MLIRSLLDFLFLFEAFLAVAIVYLCIRNPGFLHICVVFLLDLLRGVFPTQELFVSTICVWFYEMDKQRKHMHGLFLIAGNSNIFACN